MRMAWTLLIEPIVMYLTIFAIMAMAAMAKDHRDCQD